MRRFAGSNTVIYDANILVYYCFLDRDVKILGLTTKSRKLTEFLVNKGLIITVPDFIIAEIKRKTIGKIVREYLDDPKNMSRIIGMPKKPRPSLVLRIKNKVEDNFFDLEGKSWFNKEKYNPALAELNKIQNFFSRQSGTQKMTMLLSLKKRTNMLPSDEDLSLILFSNDKQLSLISNDHDITCFSEELLRDGLCYDIVRLNDIDTR